MQDEAFNAKLADLILLGRNPTTISAFNDRCTQLIEEFAITGLSETQKDMLQTVIATQFIYGMNLVKQIKIESTDGMTPQ